MTCIYRTRRMIGVWAAARKKCSLAALILAGATALVLSSAAQAIVVEQLAGGQYGAVGEVVFQPSDGGPMFDQCSGFLISPTVFVTAAHCALGNQATIGGTIGAIFDPRFDPAHSTFRPAASVMVDPARLAHPNGNQAPDVAVLILEHPVTGVDPAQAGGGGHRRPARQRHPADHGWLRLHPGLRDRPRSLSGALRSGQALRNRDTELHQPVVHHRKPEPERTRRGRHLPR
jgi:hypothetical protein